MKRLHAVVLGLSLAATAVPELAAAAPTECYDAVVLAWRVKQTPTSIPDDPDCDCFVIRWPWVTEYSVVGVVKGDAPTGPLLVQTMQHTWYIPTKKPERVWLRENDIGGYNEVGADEKAPLARCKATTPPARPYVRPAHGKTLIDLRNEGEKEFGSKR